jgi:hypothetical protein
MDRVVHPRLRTTTSTHDLTTRRSRHDTQQLRGTTRQRGREIPHTHTADNLPQRTRSLPTPAHRWIEAKQQPTAVQDAQ